jgi:hypothetical protein
VVDKNLLDGQLMLSLDVDSHGIVLGVDVVDAGNVRFQRRTRVFLIVRRAHDGDEEASSSLSVCLLVCSPPKSGNLESSRDYGAADSLARARKAIGTEAAPRFIYLAKTVV